MAKQKAVSDEQIITALLFNGTIRAAAASVGISERSIYDRMNEGEFKALYKNAKAEIIRAAVLDLNSQVEDAILTIADIMKDEGNNSAVRLQAAQTILNNAGKFAARLSQAETDVSMQINSNNKHFNIF